MMGVDGKQGGVETLHLCYRNTASDSHPHESIFFSSIISGDLGPNSVAHTYVLNMSLSTGRCPDWPQLPLCSVPCLWTPWTCHWSSQSTSCLHVGNRIPPWGNAVSESRRAALKRALSGCSAPFRFSSHCCWGLGLVASIDRAISCCLRCCSFSSSASKCSCKKTCHCQVLCCIYQSCEPFCDISMH